MDVIKIRRLCLSSMFLALGWLLPFLTGQIRSFGNMLCPMHIPVMLCGLILGPMYGLFIGFITPLTRGFIFGMPVLYPMGVCMAFELAVYGFVSGLLYRLFNKKVNITLSLYLSLVISMVLGRVVWGLARLFCGVVSRNTFTWALFMSGAFINAWPGIIVQFIVIPFLMNVLVRSKILNKFNNN